MFIANWGQIMNQPLEFLIQLLSQFAGGPGPPENNLVRFGLAAIFWGVLLLVAWNRQGQQQRPRERLLVAGFALAFFREMFMFSQQAWRTISGTEHDVLCTIVAPLEHTLTLASLVLIAGSFIRYLLDDSRLARNFLAVGLGTVGVFSAITFIWWPSQLAAQPHIHFSSTWAAWTLHLVGLILLIVAMLILARGTEWQRNVVVLALCFFALSEVLVLLNLATSRAYSGIICPIGNSFYLWAIPLFGFVYFREQSLEKRRAEEALHQYQTHLEDLVRERTAELAAAQVQLERTAALEERQRIAANLHDGLAQTLSYANMVSSHTEELLVEGDVTAAVDGCQRSQAALVQAIAEVRNCIRSLHDDPPPRQALQDCLGEALKVMAKRDGPRIEFISLVTDPIFEMPERTEHVRRIVCEAVANAVRYARASAIIITMRQSRGRLVVTVDDDGSGFDVNTAEKDNGDHFGLTIMKARAKQLGGSLHIHSTLGKGTLVTLAWPVGRDGVTEVSADAATELDHEPETVVPVFV